MEDIRIPLGNGKFLVAEASGDPLFKEIYVGLETEDGYWVDLAVIGENYTFKGEEVVPIHNEYKVRVYDPMEDCQELTVLTLENKEDI